MNGTITPESPIRMVRVLGYARVSTDDQSLDLQLDALEKAGCQRVYQEKASGRRQDRPVLDQALSALQAGDTLVVWELSRLGRSRQHLYEIMDTLKVRGVRFRSLRQDIDTDTAQGRLWFGMLALMAEYDAEVIRERTHAGLAAARARGRRGGRKPKMTPTRLKLAHQMYDSKQHTAAEIAKTLGVSERTIWRHLGRVSA